MINFATFEIYYLRTTLPGVVGRYLPGKKLIATLAYLVDFAYIEQSNALIYRG